MVSKTTDHKKLHFTDTLAVIKQFQKSVLAGPIPDAHISSIDSVICPTRNLSRMSEENKTNNKWIFDHISKNEIAELKLGLNAFTGSSIDFTDENGEFVLGMERLRLVLTKSLCKLVFSQVWHRFSTRRIKETKKRFSCYWTWWVRISVILRSILRKFVHFRAQIAIRQNMSTATRHFTSRLFRAMQTFVFSSCLPVPIPTPLILLAEPLAKWALSSPITKPCRR